jgi:hypothetical protein
MNQTLEFLWGGLTVCSGIAGLLFLRFWKETRERLLLYFALAFWILTINWLLLAVLRPKDEGTHYAYWARMAAFVVIIVGIWDQNRKR